VHAGPVRVLLLSADFQTTRLIDELLRATWSRTQLLAHAEWDAAAAQALVDHPSCCVLLDASAGPREEAMELLAYVRQSGPNAPILLLCDGDDEALALEGLKAGAQDCLPKSELEAGLLRRALTHAIERKRSEAGLAHQALHDQLTGLPNRALFLDRLGVALERARRSQSQLAVMFLDFDNFKEINDTRGHAVGDRLLAAVAERLSTLLRPMDTVARFGGDEFTFLFEELTSEREVVLIADRICHAASPPIEIDGVALSVTVSVGIAMVTDPAVSAETVIREADAAMYRAKERGRSRYELFDEESRQRAGARIELEHALVQFASWLASRPDMRLSLSLSSRQLRDPTLRTHKATGVSLALAGFGSSAASLSRMRELPIDAIKIDESFVKALGRSDEDASIVGTLVELGHALGLAVVADGVQTAAQLEQLRELGCDAAQGDLTGPAVTGEQAEALLVEEVAQVDVA